MRALEIAASQIGTQEDPQGSNWSKDLTKGVPVYLKSVNINFPASWCMAFVYWCVQSACAELKKTNPLIKTGGVMFQWNTISSAFKFSNLNALKPGDIFIMDHGHGLGHTGMIESVEGDKINTIEGNTNDTGSREGFEVCRKQRKKTDFIGVIRINL